MRSAARSGRWNRSDADAVLTEAGVADQDTTCRNGTEACPGPNGGGSLPCAACFFDTEQGDTNE